MQIKARSEWVFSLDCSHRNVIYVRFKISTSIGSPQRQLVRMTSDILRYNFSPQDAGHIRHLMSLMVTSLTDTGVKLTPFHMRSKVLVTMVNGYVP